MPKKKRLFNTYSFIRERKEMCACKKIERHWVVIRAELRSRRDYARPISVQCLMWRSNVEAELCPYLVGVGGARTRDGNAIETLLITAQINTDFVNHPVPSTSLLRVGTGAYESIVNSVLRYKNYDSHKNAHIDFQKQLIDNLFGHGCSICDGLWFRDDLRTPIAERKNV
ncbi:uncharacterized protein TNCV_2246241 [Trichonephila clavipes]|nr:uncharacterized protein TNCV_2246241 [Trichonephila clavipes]